MEQIEEDENKFSDKFVSGRRHWSKFPIKVRAHCNPLNDGDYEYPKNPDHVDLDSMYPNRKNKQIEILDIGCAYAGYLVAISPIVKDQLCLGIEIRDKVAKYSQDRISLLRKENENKYQNIWVERSNAMKYLPNYFRKGQLKKIFIMFPDPHIKQRNHKKRIVGTSLVPIYAYLLEKGGLIYTITDVKDLGDHMQKYLNESPLFKRLEEKEYENDPLVPLMFEKSEDGQHQKKKEKYLAIYRKIK